MWNWLRDGGCVPVLTLTLALAVTGCATGPDRHKLGDSVSEEEVATLERKADSARAQGDEDRALINYVKALAKDRDNPRILYKVASIHRDSGNQDVARRGYRRILELQPDHAGALEGLGLILLAKRRPDQAEVRLREAVAADPERWRSYNALGIIADLGGEHEQARTEYGKALARAPNSAVVLNNLGYSRYLAGDWDGAFEMYQRALDVEPHSAEVWSNLALLYVRQERYDDGLRAFQSVMARHEALNAVGYLCLVAGDHARASTFLQRAIDASPSYYVEAHQNLGRARTAIERAHDGG